MAGFNSSTYFNKWHPSHIPRDLGATVSCLCFQLATPNLASASSGCLTKRQTCPFVDAFVISCRPLQLLTLKCTSLQHDRSANPCIITDATHSFNMLQRHDFCVLISFFYFSCNFIVYTCPGMSFLPLQLGKPPIE